MERNGVGKISLHYSARDYLDINLSTTSSEEDWNRAIDILKDRFNERFFSTIHYLSTDFSRQGKTVDKIEKNGFAIMALNCLLIDTFYQFEYGLESSEELNPITNDRGVGRHYKDFLRRNFPELFSQQPPIGNKDLADLFYTDIRCGILHSAQTKGYSMLACEGGNVTKYINQCNDVGICVDVKQFSERLEDYFFKHYLARLKHGDVATREAFINKMRYVCNG